MAIVAGFDVHRAQITFDALDTATGELMRGRNQCSRGTTLWLSAKQLANGKRSKSLMKESSSQIAKETWLQSHRNPITRDGNSRRRCSR